MANLTMAFTVQAIMSMVCTVMPPKWPSTLAHKVVAVLFKKFKLQDTDRGWS